jgi:hypothetical protein
MRAVACGAGADENQADPCPIAFQDAAGPLQLRDCETFLP